MPDAALLGLALLPSYEKEPTTVDLDVNFSAITLYSTWSKGTCGWHMPVGTMGCRADTLWSE